MAHLTVRKIGRKVIGANEERETPPAEPLLTDLLSRRARVQDTAISAEAMLPGGPCDL